MGIISKFSDWFEKGLAHLNNEDYASSIFNFNKCLEIKSNDADVWYNIAIAYRKLGRSEYAEPCMEQSIKLNPNNPEVLKIREEVGSEIFEQTMMGPYRNPIERVKTEEKGIRERSDALLDVFRPYIMLNNSSIQILGIEVEKQGPEERNKIQIEMSGDFGGMGFGNMRFQADIEYSLKKVDPSIIFIWVVHL